MKFFSIDGPVNKYGTIVFDMIALSFLWLFASSISFAILLPLATAGFLNAINRTMIAKNGYMFEGFFEPIKKNTARNILIAISIFLALAASTFNLWVFLSGTLPFYYLTPLYLAVFFEIVSVSIFSLSLMLETELSYLNVFKFAFILANKHIFSSLLIFAVVAITTVLTLYVNYFFIVLLVAPAHLTVAYVVYKGIFSKYYLDKLSE